jgi:2-keto-4-pentenoate hydratase/2-oxohepta-3-ene-1,7-dioic acid hydratase in catechol pathway
MAPSWTHLVRFIAEEDGQIHLGQVDAKKWPDIGLAIVEKQRIEALLVKGSVFDGVVGKTILHISQVRGGRYSVLCYPLNDWGFLLLTFNFIQLLSPVALEEVPVIRCMGLNYRDHAIEANMPIPDVPVLFLKPRTAINGPSPAKVNVPTIAQDGSSDYEAELSFILSKTGRDITEEDAMDYVLGFTCSNDISARTQQFKNSQWSFSKGVCTSFDYTSILQMGTGKDGKPVLLSSDITGFDGSCPIGPVLVSPSVITDPHRLAIKAIHNGIVVQDSNTRYDKIIWRKPCYFSPKANMRLSVRQ